METIEDKIPLIVNLIQQRFRTFGGDKDVSKSNNPIAFAMQDEPASFAGGVDIADVVRFVLKSKDVLDETEEARAKCESAFAELLDAAGNE